MFEKHFGALALIIISLIALYFLDTQHSVLADQPTPLHSLQILQPIKTQSRFVTKLEALTIVIPFTIIYQDDPEKETGEDTILEEGLNGKRTKVIKITTALPSQTDDTDPEDTTTKEVISDQTVLAKDKIISRGTKIVWRTLATPDGEIRYWRKMRVYATHYD